MLRAGRGALAGSVSGRPSIVCNDDECAYALGKHEGGGSFLGMGACPVDGAPFLWAR